MQTGLPQEPGPTKASGDSCQSVSDFIQANKDVFADKLSDELPPDRGVSHTILLDVDHHTTT